MQHLSPPLWCGTAFCELAFVAQNVRVSRIHVPPHFPGPVILQPPCSEAGPEVWPVAYGQRCVHATSRPGL